MTDIPDDIIKTANAAYELYVADMRSAYSPCEPERRKSIMHHFSIALLAERQRCADVADKWATDEQRKFGDGGPAAAIMKGPTT